MMYWLILSVLLTSGEFHSKALQAKTMAECEQHMPAAQQLVEKLKEHVVGYTLSCQKVQETGQGKSL